MRTCDAAEDEAETTEMERVNKPVHIRFDRLNFVLRQHFNITVVNSNHACTSDDSKLTSGSWKDFTGRRRQTWKNTAMNDMGDGTQLGSRDCSRGQAALGPVHSGCEMNQGQGQCCVLSVLYVWRECDVELSAGEMSVKVMT